MRVVQDRPEPKLNADEIRSFLRDCFADQEELERLIQKWQDILKAADPEKNLVCKNRLIGHLWRYLYTVPSASHDELWNYALERGAITSRRESEAIFKRAISRSGTIDISQGRYSLTQEKRADMRANPRRYRLSEDEVSVGRNLT
jgi:hypothetical protein